MRLLEFAVPLEKFSFCCRMNNSENQANSTSKSAHLPKGGLGAFYTTENFAVDILVTDYISGFRDVPRFIALCKQCKNYGNSWGCPPFDFDTEAFLRQYKYAHIMATKIIPTEKDVPFNRVQEYVLPERIRIERELLEMERQIGGRSFAYVGSCLHCKGNTCTRKCGKPCLHPDKVRPSLEAFGFDISLTLDKLFGIKLLWGKDGKLPDYLVLVSGFLHNQPIFST